MSFPRGAFPTMITPFLSDGSVDWPNVDHLVDWYIRAGCVGIFAVCLSSEMYDLSREERLQLAKRVHERVAGRVRVVASGTFGGTVEEQGLFCVEMARHCDAVVVLTCQMALQGDSDEVWLENTKKLLELTGDIPLGLYECPVPYKRLLSPSLLSWASSTGRFLFHKDTACLPSLINPKLTALNQNLDSKQKLRFYNANVETLLLSLQNGGDGFSGISGNLYPFFHANLIKWFDENPKEATDKLELIQNFLGVGENVVADNYPMSAKCFLQLYGSSITEKCRKKGLSLDEVQRIKIKNLFEIQKNICQLSGVTLVPLQ